MLYLLLALVFGNKSCNLLFCVSFVVRLNATVKCNGVKRATHAKRNLGTLLRITTLLGYQVNNRATWESSGLSSTVSRYLKNDWWWHAQRIDTPILCLHRGRSRVIPFLQPQRTIESITEDILCRGYFFKEVQQAVAFHDLQAKFQRIRLRGPFTSIFRQLAWNYVSMATKVNIKNMTHRGIVR